jgi:hypothetical protein
MSSYESGNCLRIMFSGVPWYQLLDVQHLLRQGFLDILCKHLPIVTLGYMQDGAQNVA